MAIKTVNILCVNNSSLSQQLEISEKESIRNVKSKMELVEARFVYGGRELLEDEDLFELILEGTTIHMVVSGSGYAGTGESSKQQSSSKPEPLPTKLPETTTETTSCGVDLYLAPMFSLVPITPQIVTIK